jgi:hypothetical protein
LAPSVAQGRFGELFVVVKPNSRAPCRRIFRTRCRDRYVRRDSTVVADRDRRRVDAAGGGPGQAGTGTGRADGLSGSAPLGRVFKPAPYHDPTRGSWR